MAAVNPWSNVARIAPLAADLVTAVAGSTFVISDASGDIAGAGAQGLFHRDTRFLSRFELLADGARLEPLAGRTVEPAVARFVLRVPWREPGESPVGVTRSRTGGAGLREEIEGVHYGAAPVSLRLALRIYADF